jgi:hypothetical protein
MIFKKLQAKSDFTFKFNQVNFQVKFAYKKNYDYLPFALPCLGFRYLTVIAI